MAFPEPWIPRGLQQQGQQEEQRQEEKQQKEPRKALRVAQEIFQESNACRLAWQVGFWLGQLLARAVLRYRLFLQRVAASGF